MVNDRRFLSNSNTSRRGFLQGLGAAAGAVALGACGSETGSGIGTASGADMTGPLTPFFGKGGKDLGRGISWTHGMNLALTGTGAAIGVAMTQGATVAAELMKKSGGPSIILKSSDHQGGLVGPAVSGVRRLLQQEKVLSLGSSYGPATTALFPLVKSSKVTTFWSGGAGPAGLNQDFVWITMALFALDPAPGALGFLAEKFPDAKRLALIGQKENGVDAITKIAPKTWPEVSGGGSIVATEYADIGTKDFSSLVARVKSSNADVIFSTVYGNDQGYLIKQLRDANLTAPIMNIDLAVPTVPDIAGSALEKDCYLAVDGYFPDNANPYNRVFVDAYTAKYNTAPDYFAANFFEATNILAATIGAASKAGEKPGLNDVLSRMIEENPTYPSVYGGSASEYGKLEFQKDHSVIKPIGVFKIGKAGALSKVATISKDSTKVQPA
jgi:branched-chain amino acid transport system substrate-binding protein